MCPGYLTSAFLTPPNGCLDQLGPMLERLLCCSTQSINEHVKASHIARILHSLAKYPFGCGFYNQNMMHLIYDFLLLSCGIRLLMFQPCLDRILICLIRSLIYYSTLYTVSHRSEYTPHIFVNILCLFMWQHWINDTLLQCKVVSVQLV